MEISHMTRKQTQPINILMADDDEDDRVLLWVYETLMLRYLFQARSSAPSSFFS